MFQEVDVEISGVCNARCPYCVTGIENRNNFKNGKKMSFESFREVYYHLWNNNIIDKNTDFGLYNWGEPFLNSDLGNITSFLTERGQRFHLSTNASVYKPELIKGMSTLTMLIFSMCGFSQRSYDRIHGFNFERIIDNIKKYATELRESGSACNATIAYHIYQFNQDEMQKAYEFAKEIGIGIVFSYAFLNGTSLGLDYMENTMDYAQLKQMGKDIHLGYLDELLAKKEEQEECKELERLVINEECDVLMCCGVDRKCSVYSIGEVFQFSSYDEIQEKRSKIINESVLCRKCLDYGLHYWTHNPPRRYVNEDERFKKKYQKYYMFLLNQMNYKKVGEKVQEFLVNRNIHKIAIYGMGGFGIALYDMLVGTDIDVVFGIDGKVTEYRNLRMCKVEALDTESCLEEIDAIIVTPFDEFESIKRKLERWTSKEIISFEELCED